MGNTASDIASRVEGLNSQSLAKTLTSDTEVIDDPGFLLNPSKLLCRSDLDQYSVPGFQMAKPKDESILTVNQQAMIASEANDDRMHQKHRDTIRTLLEDILKQRGNDPSSKEIILRLQGICRLYQALLRQDKRKELKAKEEEKKELSGAKLPTTARVGLKFGLRTLLNLVRLTASQQPEIYKLVIDQASVLLADLPPLSMADTDNSITEVFDQISHFFNSVLKGELVNTTEDHQLASLSPLFGLALSTGSLSSVLSICMKLITLKKSPKLTDTMAHFYSMIKSLGSLKRTSILSLTWDEYDRNSNCFISKDGFSAQCRNTNWCAGLSSQTITSGIHYIEFQVQVMKDENLLIGVAVPEYKILTDWYDGGNESVTYQSSGKIWKKNNEQSNWNKWTEGDTVGFLLNMEEQSIVFIRNGEKQPNEAYKFPMKEVRLVTAMNGIHKITIVNNPESPKVAQDLMNPNQEEAKEQPEQAKESPEQEDPLDLILKPENPSEEFLNMTPSQVSILLIKKLCIINQPVLENLQSLGEAANIQKRMGLSMDIQQSTFVELNSILQLCKERVNSGDFEIMTKEECLEAIQNTLKILRAHLLATLNMQNLQISHEIRISIKQNIIGVMNLEGVTESVSEQATKTLSQCFGVFYKEPPEKLGYLIERLEDINKGIIQEGIFKELENKIFMEMARADRIYPSLQLKNEEYSATIERFFELMVEIASKESKACIKGEPFSLGIIKLLETSQIVLICQAAKDKFEGKWQDILVNYTMKVFENCDIINKILLTDNPGGNLSDESIQQIGQTIMHNLLELLLYGLMLSKMSLDFLAKILPSLQNTMGSLSQFKLREPVLTIGSAIVHECYESPHNYPDGANWTHLIKIPQAKRYILTFDPQCKTENGCDYLELWTDEGRGNRFARWEGESWPKAPVVVENELLYFTFHSDGSVNYWGWKIDIKVEVEGSYFKKQWPETSKQAASMLLASISSKLITGEFEMFEEDENIVKILENPLIMYGVNDHALQIVKQPEPLNQSLVFISTTPGVGEKLKSSLLTRSYSEDVGRRVIRSEKIATSLSDYVENYGDWGEPKYSDNPFLQELIAGSDQINQKWDRLKQKAGVTGPSTKIGGDEMNQAERAILAVYISYFEIVDTISLLFDDPADIGDTLKYIIKQTNVIRGWAQKQKQKLMDAGNQDITYTQIGKDIVNKCVFLAAAQYKLSLNQLGVQQVVRNLLGSVSRIQSKASGKLKMGSRWQAVQKAVKSMSKLRGLVNIKTVTAEDSNMADIKEFTRVAEYVNKLLESDIPVEKVVDLIQKRRTRAVAKTLGFLCLSNLINISPKQETPLIRAFGDAFRKKGVKNHYWQGLEGTDPTLLFCVQKSFFGVYGLLQKELIKSRGKPFTISSYNHYLAVLESMSCPLKGVDSHVIIELQFSSTLEILLNWSKGYLGAQVINRPFLKERCITRLGVMVENEIPEQQEKIVIHQPEEGDTMCLTIDRNGDDQPIFELKISEELDQEYEDAVGQVNIRGENKYILIKRSKPQESHSYLTALAKDLTPTFEKYEAFIADEPENEKTNREALKNRLSTSAWALFKLLMFSIVGSWVQKNQAKKIQTQELFVRALFDQITWDHATLRVQSPISSLSQFSAGTSWIGKNKVPKSFKKNPMQEWLRIYALQTEQFEDFPLTDVIQSFVEKADPGLKGVLGENDFLYIDQDIAETLSAYEQNKNSKGEYDFFRYLHVMKELASDFPLYVQEYIQASSLWQELPQDFYQAQKLFDTSEIDTIRKAANAKKKQTEDETLTKMMNLFETYNDTPGVVKAEHLPEDTPVEFKNKNGDLDFYKMIHSIIADQKFVDIREELSDFVNFYNDLPESCAEVISSTEDRVEYISSLLWCLYGCLSSQCLPILLARGNFIQPLLHLAFLSQSEKVMLMSIRILAKIIPSQHSPQSFESLWEPIRASMPEDSQIDFIETLFNWVGKGSYWYQQTISKKRCHRMEYEAVNMLNALMTEDRWKEPILALIKESVSDAIAKLTEGLPLELLNIGAVKFLAKSCPKFNEIGAIPLELGVVKLENSNIARGVVMSNTGSEIQSYSVIEDTRVTEPLQKVEQVQNIYTSNFWDQMPSDELQDISLLITQLWMSLSNSRNIQLKSKPEKIAGLRILYQNLDGCVLSIISELFAKKDEIQTEQILEIMLAILRNSKQFKSFNAKSYQQICKYVNQKRKAQKDMKEQEQKQMTEEQIMQKISTMSEQDQILAAQLVSVGVPPRIILKCYQQGVKQLQAIKSYVQTPKQQKGKTQLLYKLQAIDNLFISDLTDSAQIYQNNMSQFVINNISKQAARKLIKASLSDQIFRPVTEACPTITILANFHAQTHQGQLTFGLKVGDSQLGVTTVTGSLSAIIDGAILEQLDNSSDKLQIRIHAHANGLADVVFERGKKTIDIQTSLKQAFNGLQLGQISLYLDQGASAQLLGLEVHEGKYTGGFSSKIERPKAIEGGQRYVRVKPKGENPLRLRLRLLGLEDARINAILDTNCSLEDAVRSIMIEDFQEGVYSEKINLSQNLIASIKLLEQNQEFPGEYEQVRVYENGAYSDFIPPEKKRIAIKKEADVGGRALVAFSVVENVHSHQELGDLTQGGDDRPNMVYIKMEAPSAKAPGIKDIIYIKSDSVFSVRVPYGYQLVTDKEGKAINLAKKDEKSYYLFIAVLSVDTILNCSISLFSESKAKASSFGLQDNFDQKKEDKDSTKYEQLSLIQLYGHYFRIQESRSQTAGKDLFISLFRKVPDLFVQLAIKQDIGKLLDYISQDLSLIDSSLQKLLSDPSQGSFHEKIVINTVKTLLQFSISEGGSSLKSFTVQSSHPYENNLDIDQVLSIPGARGLRIEFDPQCHTQSGCDPLRFYQNAGRNGQIRNLSGEGSSTWTNFEVPGDTVHLYFHTDGSVVYWGYKFQVVPLGGSSGGVVVNPGPSLQILEKLANQETLHGILERVLTPNFIQALLMFSLNSSDIEEKKRSLNIIRGLLRGQNSPVIDDMLKILWGELNKLSIESQKTKSGHPILQSLILMFTKIKDMYSFKIDKEWFLEFIQLVSDMKGLALKDENLDMFFFETFKQKVEGNFQQIIESAHPYLRNTQKINIHAKGAAFLQLEFTQQSKADPGDFVFFSYDQQGKEPVNSSKQKQIKQIIWSSEKKRGDVQLSNNGLTVTRTDSSGWGSVVLQESFSTGRVKIMLHIDNDGDSAYLYFGVYRTKDSYDHTTVINYECNDDVWAWKRTGEFHRKGNHVDGPGYQTGDDIGMILDFDQKTLNFIKNGSEVHTFQDMGDNLHPVLCFGGSNQFVTIKSIEVMGAGGTMISNMKTQVVGDSAFLWFPINSGFLSNYQWISMQGTATKNSMYVITKDNGDPSLHDTGVDISCGKYFVEFEIDAIPEGEICFGVATTKMIDDNSHADEELVIYSSAGIADNEESTKFGANDKIGLFYDSNTKNLVFYKNGTQFLEKSVEYQLIDQNKLTFAVKLTAQGQVLKIIDSPSLPEGLDIFSVQGPESSNYGYKCKVTPQFKGRNSSLIETIIERASAELQQQWNQDYLPKFKNLFENGAAQQLVIYLDEFCASQGKNPLQIPIQEINPQPNDLIYYPELEKVEKPDMLQIYKILLHFNQRVKESLYLFDLSIPSVEKMTDLQRVFIGARCYIFFALKKGLLQDLMSKSNNDQREDITIDRPKAARHRDRKDVDIQGQFSIFGQIYRHLMKYANKQYRNSERIFKVNYRGEGSVDAGGPYNEVMTNMCDQLQSSFLRLLVPIQNNIHNMGENRDTWIINPAADTKADMDLFLFLGKLMGVAIRTQNNLNLAFPPLFWKRLMLEQVTVRDLRAVDVCLVEILAILRNLEANDITRETFSLAYDQRFTTKDTSGREVELIEKGKEKEVTFDNARQYAQLVESCRLYENQPAYDIIRQGMSAVVPMDYLNLFSWRQVQTLVCGAPDIDIDILKSNTDYEGCNENDLHIQFFWEVLREMDSKERSLFLKFVWGRSRLPSGRDWKHMKITRYNPPGQVNNYMPITHTCFFTIDLPAYTTKEAMRKKLLYAITHCTAIDLDGAAGQGWEADE